MNSNYSAAIYLRFSIRVTFTKCSKIKQLFRERCAQTDPNTRKHQNKFQKKSDFGSDLIFKEAKIYFIFRVERPRQVVSFFLTLDNW